MFTRSKLPEIGAKAHKVQTTRKMGKCSQGQNYQKLANVHKAQTSRELGKSAKGPNYLIIGQIITSPKLQENWAFFHKANSNREMGKSSH